MMSRSVISWRMPLRKAHVRALPTAFTLLELMVSMAVLAVLMLLLFSITSNVAKLWKETTGSISEWQSARNGFESMVRRISQATLDTTWAYFDGPNGSGGLTTTTPVSYGRHSDLHFVSGPASFLLKDCLTNVTSQAVFFQSPLGNTGNAALNGLPQLLNTCGFYVQFNNDADFRPGLPIFQNLPGKWRYRLMEVVEPSENLGVYASKTALDFSWFRNAITNGSVKPLADNVLALFILPRFSRFDSDQGSLLAPDYLYNSRQAKPFSSDVVKGNTLHQLPPLVQVVMVVTNENSAIRLRQQNGDQQIPDLFANAPFTDSSKYDDDIKKLEETLQGLGIRYRIFSSIISIRGAKWSGDEL